MIVKGTLLDGIKIRTIDVFEDFRGGNIVLHEPNCWGVDTPEFVQQNISVSRYNVLRGIHGDHRTWKEISCINGEIYFVLIDRREDSITYNKWMGITLSDENKIQVLVPPSFGNAHYVKSAFCMFHYNLSQNYDLSTQFTLRWDDPTFGIDWSCSNPVLSERDKVEKISDIS